MSKTLIFRPTRWLLLPSALLFVCLLLANLWVLNLDDKTTWPAVVIYACTFVMASLVYLENRRIKRSAFHISDHSIQIQTPKVDATVSLVTINAVASKPHWRLPFTGYGKVIVTANGREHVMDGIKDASSVADVIRQAVEDAISRQNRRNRPAFFQPPTHAAGTLELMNDLVGLWQQGMISDEEYQKEIGRLQRKA